MTPGADQTAIVRSGAAELAVSTWGTDGPVVLALHPGVGDSRIWKWCAPVWAAAGHRVVAYDRRGFGSTVAAPEPHCDLADLRAVLDATNAERVVVVGNSRGGGLALDLALDVSERVSALVLIAPSPSGYSYDDWPESMAEHAQDQLVAAAEEAGDLDLVNRLEIRYWLDGVDQPEGRVGGEARELMLDMNGIVLRADPFGEAAARPDTWSRLGELELPVLVAVGEHDLPGVRGQCAQLAAALKHAAMHTISDTAHVPMLDQPAALDDLVIEFLATVA